MRAAGARRAGLIPKASTDLASATTAKSWFATTRWLSSGFNIAEEYRGDGVISGWRDLGLRIRGQLAGELAAAADEMFAQAAYRHKPFSCLRKSTRQKAVSLPAGSSSDRAGRNNAVKQALSRDLRNARRWR